MIKHRYLILTFVFILSINHAANGLSSEIKKKYPNVLLTDDYGILNENDLAWEAKTAPFLVTVKKDFPYNYWQCFVQDRVTVTIENFGLEGEHGELTIVARSDDGAVHEYYMRRGIDIDSAKWIFDHWQKLARKGKYVCLMGGYSSMEKIFDGNKKLKKYYWVFEKIKTKKGCDSWFVGRCSHKCRQFIDYDGDWKDDIEGTIFEFGKAKLQQFIQLCHKAFT